LKIANDEKSVFEHPVYLDIRFSNKCNLKCRICGPWSSSSWTNDYSLLNEGKYQDEYITYGVKDQQKFLKDIEKILPGLKEIYLAGGEPLMIDANYQLLELLIQNGRTDVALFYNSNLSVLDYKKPGILQLWKHFSKVTVAASIDDYEDQFEFHRKNASWNTTLKNLSRIRESNPHIHLIFSPTISIYNICRITQFHKYLVERNIIELKDFIPTLLTQPEYYNIQILPATLKEKVKNDIQHHIEWMQENSAHSDSQLDYVLKQFANIITYMFSADKFSDWQILLEREKRLDFIRKENFFKTFSEYTEFQE